MKRFLLPSITLTLALFRSAIAAPVPESAAPAAATKLLPVAPHDFRDLFVWTDTCNVYVLRDGDSAVLIDLGDGSVLDHLHEIGVKRVEWVLFTSHHRELCQGYPRLEKLLSRLRRLPRPSASARFSKSRLRFAR